LYKRSGKKVPVNFLKKITFHIIFEFFTKIDQAAGMYSRFAGTETQLAYIGIQALI